MCAPMYVVQFDQFGPPEDVVACVEFETPKPAAGEILVEVEAFPINPADLLQIEGRYAVKPPLPARLGAESCGIVTELGEGVTEFAIGDRVMVLARENWASHRCIQSAEALKLPADGDPLQYAMLKVNPATATLMLTEYVTLEPGDWVIQNAANSGVGAALIRIAKQRGWRTLNVVRRDDAGERVKNWGGDVTLMDGENLVDQVNAATGGVAPKLAIDAVGGAATKRLSQSSADGAIVVNYGLLSGDACMMEAADLIFRQQTLTGFWLGGIFQKIGRPAIEALYGQLAEDTRTGALVTDVEAVYAIKDIKAAVAHAGKGGRNGKVLVRPNS
jgi:mitochondrial enoyl-[acyl-carrier protein] reductase / trans-2-enoyl-CoA reductase